MNVADRAGLGALEIIGNPLVKTHIPSIRIRQLGIVHFERVAGIPISQNWCSKGEKQGTENLYP
jgi:hypothetical protein